MLHGRSSIVIVLLLTALTVIPFSRPAVADEPTFFGKTAEDLFPDGAFPAGSSDLIKAARANAFRLLLASNIPDGHALGEGKTITVASQGTGPTTGISGTVYFC